MTEFQPDEIVRITVDVARVQKEDARWLSCLLGAHRFTVPLDGPGVTVERVAPNMQSGETWRGRDGSLWTAVENRDTPFRPSVQVLRSSSGELWPADEVAENWGPLTRVRRDEQDSPGTDTAVRAAAPDSGEPADAELLRQAAQYLRTPATTIEDQAVWLERLSDAARPLADLLDSITDTAVRHAAQGRPYTGHLATVAHALTGGASQ